MKYDDWRHYFERVTAMPEDEIDLAEAALILASDEYPDLDVSLELGRLDQMAAELRPRIGTGGTPRQVIANLNLYLFQELGFRGERENYYDPSNSYLNDVLKRRAGLPIALSVVVLAMARRLHLPIYGVGLPGHFIVKWHDGNCEILFDPFNQGEILDHDGVQARVRDVFDAHARFQSHWLDAIGTKYILIRMLNNLKSVFLQRQEMERAWQVVDKLLILEPRAGTEIRDFGLLSLKLGRNRQSAVYLEQYLLAHSDAPDAEQMRIYLRRALEQIERLN